MYITRTIEEILEDTFTDWKDFKLCYVDNIPETEMDYTLESKEYMNSGKYQKDKEFYGYNNPYIHMEEYPNPNYIEGEREYYAYFTDLDDLQEQWGDDWNDAPYEHNAGWPYDSIRKDEHTILRIPFAVVSESCSGSSHWVKFPCDYGCGNSPFSVEEINAGAVPWIFVSYYNMAKNKKFLAVNAGINPLEFINELRKL
jgi:hypothetical protein